MKSIRAKLLAIVLVLAMVAAIILPACSLITLNKEREANQALVTVTNNGITITISKNEITDHFYTVYSQNAQYVQQGYFKVEELLKYALESKIKTAYLLTEAMPFLVNKELVSQDRIKVLSGKGSTKNPREVLTEAEKSLAIYSVNKNMDDSLKQLKETAKIKALNSKLKGIKTTDVKAVHFTEATKLYLQDVYYADDKIDREKVNVYVEYNDGSKSEEFPVASSMYKTEFSTKFEEKNSSKTPEEKVIEVVFTEEKGSGKDATTIEHKIEHKYTLKSARPTKNKPEEVVKLEAFKIGDVEVGRYDTVAQLKEKDAYYVERDFDKELAELKTKDNADAYLIEAYEDLLSNLKRGHKSVAYYYDTAYKTTVTAALQAELGMRTKKELTDAAIEKEIIAQFDFLYESAKAEYQKGNSEADIKKNNETFVGKIKDKIDTLYYYPAYENLTGVYYVYNTLFNFSEAQKEFLNKEAGTGEDLKKHQQNILKEMMTKPANPDYDPEFECPLHKNREEGATCAHEGEGVCPAVPFGKVVGGETVVNYEEKVIDVLAKIESELKAIYDDASKDAETKSKEALALFERYMYTYSEDPGILNNSIGYYGQNDGFDKNFLELTKAVWEHNPTVGNAFGWDDKNNDGIKDANEIGLTYRFSTYGLHIVAISFVPFGKDANNKELTFANDAEKVAYLKRSFDNTGKTYYDNIKKSIVDAKLSAAYTDYQAEKTPEKFFEINKDNKITPEKELKSTMKLETKLLNKLIKEYMGK